jgi:hypothetical protein
LDIIREAAKGNRKHGSLKELRCTTIRNGLKQTGSRPGMTESASIPFVRKKDDSKKTFMQSKNSFLTIREAQVEQFTLPKKIAGEEKIICFV